MIDLADLTLNDIGRWVVYRASNGSREEGRIKRFNNKVVWVVFHCDEDWDRYADFTPAVCSPENLEFKE